MTNCLLTGSEVLETLGCSEHGDKVSQDTETGLFKCDETTQTMLVYQDGRPLR